MFDDERWVAKLAIGGLLLIGATIFSPILIGLALLCPLGGYMIQTLRNVQDRQPQPLPEWSHFGSLFAEGLKVFVIGLIYHLPAFIFFCLLSGVLAAAPTVDADVAQGVNLLFLSLICIASVFVLVANFLLPAGLIHYAQSNRFRAAFQFGQIFSFISGRLGDYIITVLLGLVAQSIAGIGVMLCGIGIFFTTFWSFLVMASLYGQLARLAAPSPAQPAP
jgi:hypothetical protein